jgi:hypothetical protein
VINHGWRFQSHKAKHHPPPKLPLDKTNHIGYTPRHPAGQIACARSGVSGRRRGPGRGVSAVATQTAPDRERVCGSFLPHHGRRSLRTRPPFRPFPQGRAGLPASHSPAGRNVQAAHPPRPPLGRPDAGPMLSSPPRFSTGVTPHSPAGDGRRPQCPHTQSPRQSRP